MTWWGLGSMAVGAVIQYTQADRDRDIAAGIPPKPVGTILSTPGGTTNPYGGSTYDPATGLLSQYANNFDPRRQGRVNDADMMYNQFMGLGNDRVTGNMDVEIQQLEREIARLQAEQTGTSGVGRNQGFAELNPTLKQFVDDKGNPLDVNSLRGNQSVIQAYNEHVARSGGKKKNSAGKWLHPLAGALGTKTTVDMVAPGKNPDFDKWFEEWRRNAGYDAAAKNYQDLQGKQQGNQSVRDQAIKTLQDKLGYAQKERERVGAGSDMLSQNPLMKYLNDLGGGGMLGGGGGNLPPWLQERLSSMDQTAASARARSSGGPLDVSLDTSGIDEFIDRERADGDLSSDLASGLNTGYAGSIDSPDLDLREASLRARMLDAQTRQTFDAQRNLRDQQSARRGMLSSSTSEIGGAGDSLGLANAMNSNALGATEGYNRALAQQFGMDLGAEGFNAQERGNLFGRELGKVGAGQADRAFGQSERNRQFSNLIGQGQLKLGANQLRLASKSQADQQANWADSFGQDTDRFGVGQNWQLYGALRDENQDAYSRNLGMYNLLNSNAASARGEDRQDFALGQGTGQAGRSDYWANQQNQYNAARAQMQNSQNMAGWNQGNADRAAQNQMWGNLGQGFAGAAGNYFGSQQKKPAGTYNSGPTAWDQDVYNYGRAF